MQRIVEFQRKISSAKSLDELFSQIVWHLKQFGFYGFTICVAPVRKGKVDSSGVAFYTSLPEPLEAEYRAKQMATFDLVFDLMSTRYAPYTKNSIESMFDVTPQQQQVVEYANKHDLGDAFMVPLSTLDYCRGFVMFTEESAAEFQQRIEQESPLLRHFAMLAMTRAEELGFGSDAPSETLLTRREVECLQVCAQGKTNEEIAAALGVSERTVRFHLSNACEKLGTTRRSQAVTRAIQQGLIRT